MTIDADSPRSPVADRLLDRLVDGEVGTDERAGLLAALDAEPGGWRRCAVAFLEAQAWRVALGTTATESPAAQPRPRQLPLARYGAIAAAFVVAFVAGFVTRGGSGSPSTSHAPQDGRYATRAAQNDHSANATARSASAARSPAPASVRIRPDSRVRLPVFESGDADGVDVSRQPSALPEYVRKQLERQGYEVEGDRQVLSVALDDGRSVTVPVERLKYRYVGYRVH